MYGIGGNTEATIQTYTVSKNAIGESVKTWSDALTIKGWLDLSSGDSNYTNYYSKVQESTHIFIADYVQLESGIRPEKARMLINGQEFDIKLIDNPMGLGEGSQLEFYLKYTGG